MLLVDAAHESSSRGKDLVDEDKDRLLRRQLNSLADNIDELSHCQVRRDKIFLLVDGSDVALLDLLANDLFDAGAVSDASLMEPSSAATRRRCVKRKEESKGRAA